MVDKYGVLLYSIHNETINYGEIHGKSNERSFNQRFLH
jgi:hypothetical protein